MYKEMLELAAKAAGIDGNCARSAALRYLNRQGKPEYWTPVDDDGDALRLAVYLDMEITVNRVDGFTEVVAGYLGDIPLREMHGDDMYAATRLAITKAAAEIGRRM